MHILTAISEGRVPPIQRCYEKCLIQPFCVTLQQTVLTVQWLDRCTLSTVVLLVVVQSSDGVVVVCSGGVE